MGQKIDIEGTVTISLSDLDMLKEKAQKYNELVSLLITRCSYISGNTSNGQEIVVDDQEFTQLLFSLHRDFNNGENRPEKNHLIYVNKNFWDKNSGE